MTALTRDGVHGDRVLPPIPRPEDRGGRTRQILATATGTSLIGGFVILFTAVLARTEYDTWIAYALAPAFFLVAAPLLRRMLRQVEPDEWIHRAIILGLAAKLTGAFVRYYTNEYVLGHGDARNYFRAGTAVSEEFRSFVFGGPAFQEFVPNITGTRFINLLTSLVYVVSGSTQLGGYVIFSFMSFWGMYLFYRAYSIALPDGLRRRYVVLVFFLPSVVFWPSSIGKEAWMITMLGLGAYGIARLLTFQRFGYLSIIAAMAGMGIVRPHVAAIFGAGLGAAAVLRRGGEGATATKRVLSLIVLAVIAGVLMNQLQAFFGLEGALDAQQLFDETTRRSSQGGTQFETAQPTSITGLPWAIVTVLFRPFIFEAANSASIVTGIEGTILLVLFVWNLPRLVRLPALMVKHPFVGFAVIYTVIFIFAFSAISNFGILARQRTQLFPIVSILLTVPVTNTLQDRKSRMQGRSNTSSEQPAGSSSWRTHPGTRTSPVSASKE